MPKSHNKSLAGTNHHRSVEAYFFARWRAGPALLQLHVILRKTHSRAFLKEEIIFFLTLSSTPELLPGITGQYQKPDCQEVGLCWERKDPKANHGASLHAFTDSTLACSSTKPSTEKLVPTLRFKLKERFSRSEVFLFSWSGSVHLSLNCITLAFLGNRKKTYGNSWWDFSLTRSAGFVTNNVLVS